MKIVTSCDHVVPDGNRWFNREDDGKFTIIFESCQSCFIKANRLISSQDQEVTVIAPEELIDSLKKSFQ